MKWIYLTFITFICFYEGYSQEVIIKHYDITLATPYEATLTISETNLYDLRLFKYIDQYNIEWSAPVISKGEVKKQGKYLLLEDAYTHSKMIVDTSGQKVRFIRSFKFLQNSVSYSSWTGTSDSEFRNWVYDPDNGIRNDNLISNRRAFNDTARYWKLPYGHYYSESKNFDIAFIVDGNTLIRPPLHLELAEPHYYKVYLSGLTISEGIFTRNKNILLLYDTSIKCVYHLLIKQNKLQSMLMPLDYEGVELGLNNYNK